MARLSLLHNLAIVIYYFTPIWAWIIWRFVPIKGKLALLAIEACLFALTVWLAWNPHRLPKISNWLHWYTFFLMAYMLIFTVKFGYADVGKILALGLWMVFVAGDLWEYPVFFYDGFGWLNGFHVWTVDLWTWLSSHIHRAYVIATLILMVKLAGIRLNLRNGLLAFASTFLGFVGLYPWSTYRPLSTVVHIVSLSLFAFIILLGEPDLGVAVVGA